MKLLSRSRPSSKPALLALAAVLLFALLVACGGDDEPNAGDSGTGPSPDATGAGNQSGGGQTNGDSLAVPDDDTLTRDTFDLPRPGEAVLYAFDSAWVFSFDLDTPPALYKVDPITGAVAEPIEVPTVTPAMLAGSDALWLVGRALFKVDPASGSVEQVDYQELPDLGFTPRWGIWGDRIFAVSDDGKVYELDTTTGGFSLAADSGATDTGSAAYSGQYVWIENVVEQAGTLDIKRTLIGIDLSDGSEVGRVELDATELGSGGGAIWALSTLLGDEEPGYYRIEPATGDFSFQQINFAETPFLVSVTADDSGVWLSYQGGIGGDFVLRVTGGSVARATVASPFPSLVAGGEAVWLVDSDTPVLERIAP